MVSAAIAKKDFLGLTKKLIFWSLRISVTIGLFAYIFCYLIDFHDQVALKNGNKARLLQRDGQKLLVQSQGRSYWIDSQRIDIGKGHHGFYPGLFSVIKKLNLWLFIVCCSVLFVSVGFSALRFQLLLQAHDIFLPYLRLLKINFIGHFFNNFLPGFTGGDLVRGYYITKESRQLAKSVVCILVDRIVGLAGLVLLSGIILSFLAHRREFREAAFIIFSGVGGIVGATALLFLFPQSWLSKDSRWVSLLKNVMVYRRCPWILLKTLGITFLIHINTNIMMAGFARALAIEHLPWYVYFIYTPVAILLMALPISVAGWGVGEAAFAYFFTQVGVTAEQAVVIVLLFRVANMVIGLTGGCIWFLRPLPVETRKD